MTYAKEDFNLISSADHVRVVNPKSIHQGKTGMVSALDNGMVGYPIVCVVLDEQMHSMPLPFLAHEVERVEATVGQAKNEGLGELPPEHYWLESGPIFNAFQEGLI